MMAMQSLPSSVSFGCTVHPMPAALLLLLLLLLLLVGQGHSSRPLDSPPVVYPAGAAVAANR
jgi:hypothetical protein